MNKIEISLEQYLAVREERKQIIFHREVRTTKKVKSHITVLLDSDNHLLQPPLATTMSSNMTSLGDRLPLYPTLASSSVLDHMSWLLTPSLSMTSVFGCMLVLVAVLMSYMTYLYARLSQKKSARPFEEIPTVPNVQ